MTATSPASRTETPLARLHALEWLYDGPVPAGMLAAVDATPAELGRRAAASDEVVTDRLAREAVWSSAAARRSTRSAAELEAQAGPSRLAVARTTGLLLHAGRGGGR